MKTELALQTRAFPVVIQDQRTGEIVKDTIVLEKEHLRATQLVGQSSTELIFRLYNRKGYKVLDIGSPTKREIYVDLEKLLQPNDNRVHDVPV